MILLLLSIFCSSAIFIIFKIFSRYNVDTFQAIVINYFTAFLCGVLSNSSNASLTDIAEKDWFFGALILSVLFITVFNLMGVTSQKNGVAVASVAGKMSIVIPVIFGIYLYNETLNLLNILGVFLALAAVYLATYKPSIERISNQWLFPLLLFIGSGIIDTFIKYMQHHYVAIDELPLFSATIFCFAGILGCIGILIKRKAIQLRNIIAGFFLGIVNYYSIIFLLKALHQFSLPNQTLQLGSGIVFTINNVAIVVCTTILGLLLFKEQLSLRNWSGIAIAIISILLLT